MELRHLEQFLAVAEERNFTRAAARLHLVQSALSVSVRALEKDLGAQLFDRSTHHVELTDAGRALLPEARRVLASVETARDAVAAVHGGVRGTVRIGIMHSLALIDLAAIFTEFHRSRPGVQLLPQAAQGGSAELVANVAHGRLDLAFAAMPDRHPGGLTVRQLAAEPMALACPPQHQLGRGRTVALRRLDGQRFVDFPPGWGTRAAADRLFQAEGLHREIAVEIADIPNVLDLVDAGFGFAFVSPSTVPAPRRRRLRWVEPAPTFSVSLVTSTALPLTAATAAFIDLVAQRYPAATTSA